MPWLETKLSKGSVTNRSASDFFNPTVVFEILVTRINQVENRKFTAND